MINPHDPQRGHRPQAWGGYCASLLAHKLRRIMLATRAPGLLNTNTSRRLYAPQGLRRIIKKRASYMHGGLGHRPNILGPIGPRPCTMKACSPAPVLLLIIIHQHLLLTRSDGGLGALPPIYKRKACSRGPSNNSTFICYFSLFVGGLGARPQY